MQKRLSRELLDGSNDRPWPVIGKAPWDADGDRFEIVKTYTTTAKVVLQQLI
jgi:hypothetical protein